MPYWWGEPVRQPDSRTACVRSGAAASQPLPRLSAAEAVFNALRREIESGTVGVGAKLSSETALAQQYGVSRSVVREALRSCTALGLTVTKTGKGTFVVADHVAKDLVLGQYSARDLTEARPHIEVPAAGLAAQRRTAEELDSLRDIVAAMAAEDDPEAWVGLDSSFHAPSPGPAATRSSNTSWPTSATPWPTSPKPSTLWPTASLPPTGAPADPAAIESGDADGARAP